jgi:phage tail-like protein
MPSGDVPSNASPIAQVPLWTGGFKVDVMGKTLGVFGSVRGLELHVDYLEYRQGGWNDVVLRLPGPLRYPNLVLSQGVTQQGALEQWMDTGELIADTHTLVVTLYAGGGTVVRTWSFANAYPVRWTGPVLTPDGSLAAGEEIEVAHAGFVKGASLWGGGS